MFVFCQKSLDRNKFAWLQALFTSGDGLKLPFLLNSLPRRWILVNNCYG